jgi:hypothetical protein
VTTVSLGITASQGLQAVLKRAMLVSFARLELNKSLIKSNAMQVTTVHKRQVEVITQIDSAVRDSIALLAQLTILEEEHLPLKKPIGIYRNCANAAIIAQLGLGVQQRMNARTVGRLNLIPRELFIVRKGLQNHYIFMTAMALAMLVLNQLGRTLSTDHFATGRKFLPVTSPQM